MILITSKNLDEMKREKIRDALRSFSVDLDIPLLPEGVLLPEEMLLDAGLPCDPELLEEAWDEAREDAVLSRVPAGLRELLKCIGIHPASVRDAIVEGGYEF